MFMLNRLWSMFLLHIHSLLCYIFLFVSAHLPSLLALFVSRRGLHVILVSVEVCDAASGGYNNNNICYIS